MKIIKDINFKLIENVINNHELYDQATLDDWSKLKSYVDKCGNNVSDFDIITISKDIWAHTSRCKKKEELDFIIFLLYNQITFYTSTEGGEY